VTALRAGAVSLGAPPRLQSLASGTAAGATLVSVGRCLRKALQFLPWWAPLAVAGTALVVLRNLLDNGTTRFHITKGGKPMKTRFGTVSQKAASAVRSSMKAVLETLWATGCSILATAAVPS
jgi:hypothetical protein